MNQKIDSYKKKLREENKNLLEFKKGYRTNLCWLILLTISFISFIILSLFIGFGYKTGDNGSIIPALFLAALACTLFLLPLVLFKKVLNKTQAFKQDLNLCKKNIENLNSKIKQNDSGSI